MDDHSKHGNDGNEANISTSEAEEDERATSHEDVAVEMDAPIKWNEANKVEVSAEVHHETEGGGGKASSIFSKLPRLSMHQKKHDEETKETGSTPRKVKESIDEGAPSGEAKESSVFSKLPRQSIQSRKHHEETKETGVPSRTVRESINEESPSHDPKASTLAVKIDPTEHVMGQGSTDTFQSRLAVDVEDLQTKLDAPSVASHVPSHARYRKKSMRTKKREEVHCRVRFAILGVIMAASGVAAGTASLQMLSTLWANQTVFDAKLENTLAWMDNYTTSLEKKLIQKKAIIDQLKSETLSRLEREVGINDFLINTNAAQDRRLIARLVTNCNDLFGLYPQDRSGIYNITINDIHQVAVFCDMETDGGGWTVFLKRDVGVTNFARNLSEYEEGFGHRNKDYWLGFKFLRLLMGNKKYSLRVDLEAFDASTAFAKYSSFLVGDSTARYALRLGNYTGTAGDSLLANQPFSAFDQDNDTKVDENCAETHGGGWWYTNCGATNLNGKYYISSVPKTDQISWDGFAENRPLKSVMMKVREELI